jgi:hypothetical protein
LNWTVLSSSYHWGRDWWWKMMMKMWACSAL